MWTSAMSAMVTGVLLVAGTAMAQTAGPRLGAAAPAIIPVTGATATSPAPRTVKKAAHRPATKPTAKKTSAGKPLAKGAGSAKGQHVAAAKPQPVVHRGAVKKPMPTTKAPAKGGPRSQPVLPRV